MTIIKLCDQRALGVCKGARHWFERHGLDWRAYLRDGIDVADLRATGDIPDLIDKLEAQAKMREAREDGGQ